jgi:3,5-dihydroxyphenylacetyl-CoA synthase
MTTYLNDQPSPRILSVGTSHPPRGYSQREVLDLFQVTDAKIGSIFENSHIERRYLHLPQPKAAGGMPEESSLELWKKHRAGTLLMGADAIARALKPIGASVLDIDYLVCVTSTGFLCPGLTAHFIKELGFRPDVHRVDVVGMGCNAGLNALQPMANFCALNQDKLGLQLCVEVCSAAYVFDGTIGSAVVNCLFGDGAAAVVVGAKRGGCRLGPRLLGFQSHIIPSAIEAMRFDYDGNKYAFHLDRDIPYVIGENVATPVGALLSKCGLKRRDVAHWVVHSGGRKVIDSIKYSMGLSDHDVRHTQGVLSDYGNLSSASFLFSLDRLMHDEQVASGDHVVLITMGPGSTIECSLGRF